MARSVPPPTNTYRTGAALRMEIWTPEPIASGASYTPAAMAVKWGTQTPLALSQRTPSAPGIASAYHETAFGTSGRRGGAGEAGEHEGAGQGPGDEVRVPHCHSLRGPCLPETRGVEVLDGRRAEDG